MSFCPLEAFSPRTETHLNTTFDKLVLKSIPYHLTIDEEECYAEVGNRPDEIGKRAEKKFFEIHGTNAVFMEEDKL